MKTGDTVTVYALAANLRAEAKVILASNNNQSLALAFPEPPAFLWGEPPLGFALHPDYGPMLLLLQDDVSRPFWMDVFSDRYFNVEERESKPKP
jgi:hypothetical protein